MTSWWYSGATGGRGSVGPAARRSYIMPNDSPEVHAYPRAPPSGAGQPSPAPGVAHDRVNLFAHMVNGATR